MGFTSYAGSNSNDIDMRQKFMDQYGVSIDFPGYYSDSGVLVPHVAGFIVSSGFHIIPKSTRAQIQVNPYSEEESLPETENLNFSDMYDCVGSSLILKLQEMSDRSGFKTHRQVQLGGVRDAKYAFSPSGKYFAIFLQATKTISVFNSTDIFNLFDDLEPSR
jgi:hypothetical protein